MSEPSSLIQQEDNEGEDPSGYGGTNTVLMPVCSWTYFDSPPTSPIATTASPTIVRPRPESFWSSGIRPF